ncbi:hypothetical protein [Curtobacterium sp. L1-20]|jgi:hypothetical protein|uniref:hypothetical protein n=1 Tax=Curtobacterium sp. L1-20 TaxID=3138181 RepID=UPI003B52A729
MIPRSSTSPAPTGHIRWVHVDQWTWDAVVGTSTIATVTDEDRYVVRLADGEVAGVHTSLESARSQLDAWVRWETTPHD